MELPNYRDNLRHVVRPDDTAERESANCITLLDYEALYAAMLCREWAGYADSEHTDIALAYAEYIDMVVRDEGRRSVNLYAHTSEAVTVLQRVFEYRDSDMAQRLRDEADKL